MPALAITLLTAALWWLQGIGFARRLLPDVDQPIVIGILATGFGALASTIALVELYFVVPGATVGQLAWPVTLALVAASLFLWWRAPRRSWRFDPASTVVLAIALFGTLLVLRPLAGSTHLGFYFSNNGEFANYAAIGDIARFHDAATDVGGFGLHSREAVGALPAAVIAQLTGTGALWVIEPVAAAMALLSFASVGLLFLRIAGGSRWPARVAVGLIYAWAVLSASAQCFWTLSFVSQYLCIALWFGTLALLGELPVNAERARTLVLGLAIGALAYVYPEMIVPSTGLLCAAEVARVPRHRTLVRIAVALGIAIVVANRLGFELVLGHTGLGGGGWNIFGPHRPALDFFAAIAGFTNPFSGPHAHHVVVTGLAALAFVAALGLAIARSRAPAHREVRALMGLFALGVVGIFAIVARHADGNNYIALKLLLGFGWLAYLGLAAAVVEVAGWQPRAGFFAIAIVLVCWLDLARGSYRFTKQLYRARKTATYYAHDAVELRRAAGPAPIYVAAGWFNTFIIGAFTAYDGDLFEIEHAWPDKDLQRFTAGQPVLVLDDFDPGKDPRFAAYKVAWTGHHMRLLVQ